MTWHLQWVQMIHQLKQSLFMIKLLFFLSVRGNTSPSVLSHNTGWGGGWLWAQILRLKNFSRCLWLFFRWWMWCHPAGDPSHLSRTGTGPFHTPQCFPALYHWRFGGRKGRPPTGNISWDVTFPNSLPNSFANSKNLFLFISDHAPAGSWSFALPHAGPNPIYSSCLHRWCKPDFNSWKIL